MRYQHPSDIRTDLQRLKRDSESGCTGVVSAPGVANAATATPTTISATTPSTSSSSTAISGADLAPPTSIFGTRRRYVALALVLAVATSLVFLFYARRSSTLTEKDAVLVTDFVNTIGDAVFDGTLRRALIVGLEQSPYLNVVPDQKVQETLKFMGRSPDERINTAIGREICLRDGVKAMLTGPIANLGNQYVITLNAIDASKGDSLGEEQVQASSKEQLLNAKATGAMRQKLGESLVRKRERIAQNFQRSSLTLIARLRLPIHSASTTIQSP
jgi:hypothetical protein